MKKSILCLFFLVSTILVKAQNLDLIVKNSTDSIACKIDSINTDIIYFKIIASGNILSTSISTDVVTEHKYNCINPKTIRRIPNTIFFKSKRHYSYDKERLGTLNIPDLNDHYNKARTTKKAGVVMLLGGPPLFLLGAAASVDSGSEVAAFLILTGMLATTIGIPVTFIGVKRTRAVKVEYSYRNIPLTAKISPKAIQMSQPNQIATGISFTISF